MGKEGRGKGKGVGWGDLRMGKEMGVELDFIEGLEWEGGETGP